MEIPELIALLQAKIKCKFDNINKEENRIGIEKSELANQLRSLDQLLKELYIQDK
jgi:hypothetical protein